MLQTTWLFTGKELLNYRLGDQLNQFEARKMKNKLLITLLIVLIGVFIFGLYKFAQAAKPQDVIMISNGFPSRLHFNLINSLKIVLTYYKI